MRMKGIEIGMVINLCATTRFYDPRQFTYNDIEFHHIICRGHQPPSQRVEETFSRICTDFIHRSDKLIAVHCTHGCNRTGYMICSYLNAFRRWPIHHAICEFARQRPPGIYRRYIIQALLMIGSVRNQGNQVPNYNHRLQPPPSRSCNSTNSPYRGHRGQNQFRGGRSRANFDQNWRREDQS